MSTRGGEFSWAGEVSGGWQAIIGIADDRLSVCAVDVEGASWAGHASEPDVATRARVDGGVLKRLRDVLADEARGQLSVGVEGELTLRVPFGRGDVVAGRMHLSRGPGFGARAVVLVAEERSGRLRAEEAESALQSRCAELERALDLCRRAKESTEAQLLAEFSAVLNEKKRKIAELLGPADSGGTRSAATARSTAVARTGGPGSESEGDEVPEPVEDLL